MRLLSIYNLLIGFYLWEKRIKNSLSYRKAYQGQRTLEVSVELCICGPVTIHAVLCIVRPRDLESGREGRLFTGLWFMRQVFVNARAHVVLNTGIVSFSTRGQNKQTTLMLTLEPLTALRWYKQSPSTFTKPVQASRQISWLRFY